VRFLTLILRVWFTCRVTSDDLVMLLRMLLDHSVTSRHGRLCRSTARRFSLCHCHHMPVGILIAMAGDNFVLLLDGMSLMVLLGWDDHMMDDVLNNLDRSMLHNMMYNRGFVRN